ncbi:MAG: GIY-YIG nuclease family protein [Proteobacteria bacterium]|nr:GIY-YIG nuclease family protein [Candidatus Enterousia onthequi]
MKSGGYVYIMASKRMGTLYIGSTSNLIVRVWEHKNKIYPKSFTAKYHCNKLVYYEYQESLDCMVKRERQLKEWNRNWKIKLILENNPDWKDLYPDFLIANGYATE